MIFYNTIPPLFLSSFVTYKEIMDDYKQRYNLNTTLHVVDVSEPIIEYEMEGNITSVFVGIETNQVCVYLPEYNNLKKVKLYFREHGEIDLKNILKDQNGLI